MNRNNGSSAALVGNNGVVTLDDSDFMSSLRELLHDEDLRKEVMRKPRFNPKEVDVMYRLSEVEKMLNLAFIDDVAYTTRAEGNQGQSNCLTSPSIGTSVDLTSTINKLCDKFKAPQTKVEKQTMQSLVDELSSFSWDAKAVLTLLAFTLYCTKNCRYTEYEATDELLSLAATLQGKTPTAMTKASGGLCKLIEETLNFTKGIVEFGSYSKNSRGMSEHISKNSYYIIVFVLGCSVLFSMISAGNELTETDLSDFSEEVTNEYQNFKEAGGTLLYQNIKDKHRDCSDILELMTALFSSTVYQCSKKTAVKVDELKNKRVMLLISGLNLSKEDRKILTNIHNVRKSKSHNYEIMWVPIVEPHDEVMHKQFLEKRSQMQWYTCTSMVSKPAAMFIQEQWQFRQQTMVVVLNEKGKVMNKNAIMMIRLRGWEAHPFEESNDKELWQEINLFELVVDKMIYPYIKQHFETEEPLLLYCSAEDSKTIHEIEEYLEKIKGCDVSCKDIRFKEQEQFLIHLENCIASKRQATSDDNDSLTQQLLKLYTSYKEQGGFAIIASGSNVVFNASLMDFATVLSQHQMWIEKVTQTESFVAVFQEHYNQVIVKARCCHLYIPSMVEHVPKRFKCSTCSHDMTAVAYKCWHYANTSQ